ncbi:hypothetical protein D8674_039477 [Pyrus ussuriensis x Pyrus communis]|uniref:Uncharacterized protein n=1 Tax=Pyrus ussuriensis x Pyrus communis TaxID=2448454 RepID=A0A5N5H0P4_9ROSA|nr:hypothetical protein D8674_039477 [Pyrus ussuriensis x Pyrus communis]
MADTEMDELEKDLMSLQSELAWAEQEDSKIACIDTSIRSLKSKDMNNIAVQLLTRREPAENIQEILKALMQKYFPKKYEQVKLILCLYAASWFCIFGEHKVVWLPLAMLLNRV